MDATPVGLPEHKLAARLADLGVVARVGFAAACAELLWPTVTSHFRGDEAAVALLRHTLDAAWDAASPAPLTRSSLARDDSSGPSVEDLVPDEDDPDFDDEAALAQNGVAAIAYALRTATVDPLVSDDPDAGVQTAVWAARQVTDAADLVADRAACLDSSGAPALAEVCITDFLLAAENGDADLRQLAVRRADQMADALDVQHRA